MVHHSAQLGATHLQPKRPQAGNSNGCSQVPSPHCGSRQKGVTSCSSILRSRALGRPSLGRPTCQGKCCRKLPIYAFTHRKAMLPAS